MGVVRGLAIPVLLDAKWIFCGVNVILVDGELLDQGVDVVANAWNRNIIPWWLLIPQGVSGAIKKRGARQPFREPGRMGAIPLGHAVKTSPGSLAFNSIIHGAGINVLWRLSERSIPDSIRNAISIARYAKALTIKAVSRSDEVGRN